MAVTQNQAGAGNAGKSGLAGQRARVKLERAARVATEQSAQDAPLTIVPDRTAAVLAQLQTIIDTTNRVVTYSHHADGRIKNPRMALASIEALRKSLETALSSPLKKSAFRRTGLFEG